jgi:hypothetical protein
MFKLFRRRRASAPPSAPQTPQAHGTAPPHTADDAEAWQRWDGPAAAKPAPPQRAADDPAAAPAASVAPNDNRPVHHDSASHGSGSTPGGPPPLPPDPPRDPPSNTPAPPRGLALDEIARGMQHAAASANQLLAQQYTRVLDSFFDPNDDGLLTARTVDVELDAEHAMPVPLVALATPRGLALEKMVVHLTVRGDFAEAMPIEGGDHRAHFHVTLAPPSKRAGEAPARDRDTEHIDIEMHFAALDPPDAIMRVIDEYTHRLIPRPKRGAPTDEENSHA